MNRYKIDVNTYVSSSFPYALYVKRAWWRRWQHIESFKTVEAAKAVHDQLAAMPIFLPQGN